MTIDQSAGNNYALALNEYPATEAQMREWQLFINGQQRRENLLITGFIEHIDRGAFNNACLALANRHESLRTTYSSIDNHIIQHVRPVSDETPFIYEADLSAVAEPVNELNKFENDMRKTAFDLINGPVYRIGLAKINQQTHVYLFVVDKIAADALSIEIIKREFDSIYAAFTSKSTAHLKPITFQIKDYALWEQQTNNGPTGKANLAYVLKELAKPLPSFKVKIPLNEFTPASGSYVGGKFSFFIDSSAMLVAKKAFPNSTMFLTTVLSFWLSWLIQNHIVFLAMPISTRESEKLNRIVGRLITTLYLRIEYTEGISFNDLHELVIEKYSEALAHRQYSRMELPKETDSFCTAMLKTTPEIFKQLDYAGEQLSHQYTSEASHFPMDCEITTFKNGVVLSVHYNLNSFENKEAAGLFYKIATLFKAVIQHPDILLSALDHQLSDS